jgi:hypothetical protein
MNNYVMADKRSSGEVITNSSDMTPETVQTRDDTLPGSVFMTLFGQRSEAVLLRVLALYGDSINGLHQYEIAEYLGFSAASVSRALSKIEKIGLIYRTTDGIGIDDYEMLSTVREFLVLLDGEQPDERVEKLVEIDPEHKQFDSSYQIPDHALNDE